MKALIFDPYLDTIGGGERYMMTVAECLLKKRWAVDVSWDDEKIKEKMVERFGLNLDGIKFIKNIQKISLFSKKTLMKNYDLVFYLSDGSIPFLFGKKNILHLQVPFSKVSGRSLRNKLKFKTINEVVCNSVFTKNVIDSEFGISSKVIYPPIAIDVFYEGKKEDMILSVGRFSSLLQSKRQDVLVKAFKKAKLPNVKFVLAGGTDVGKNESFQRLKTQAKGENIKIIENPNFNELKALYAKAKIFWIGSGFGVDEKTFPEKVEHFGMTTVEAMASGCVPIVINKGGQKEIIENGVNGFLWEKEEELIGKTKLLLKDNALREKMAKKAKERSKIFSKDRFCQEILKLVE